MYALKPRLTANYNKFHTHPDATFDRPPPNSRRVRVMSSPLSFRKNVGGHTHAYTRVFIVNDYKRAENYEETLVAHDNCSAKHRRSIWYRML